jgi:hypothetical protein
LRARWHISTIVDRIEREQVLSGERRFSLLGYLLQEPHELWVAYLAV